MEPDAQADSPENASPAGWYPDPAEEHEQRYWDGTAWTDDVYDPDPATEDTFAAMLAAPDAAPAEPRISGFWRRVAAFCVDSLLVGIFGFGLGLALSNQLVTLGAWGRLIGFSIALAYYSILDSRIGGGQTLGKRLLDVRVVDRSGASVTPARAALRYAIFAAPMFLNGLSGTSVSDSMTQVGAILGSIAVFGVGGATAYLVVFNRRTRQGLHDLATGTFVARATPSGSLSGSVGRIHLVVAGLVLVTSVVVAIAGPLITARNHDYAAMMTVARSVEASVGLPVESVWLPTTVGPKGYRSRGLVLGVRVADDPTDHKDTTRKIARIVLDEYPGAGELDYIRVVVTRGFDIGIATGWTRWNETYSPAEWRDKLDASRP